MDSFMTRRHYIAGLVVVACLLAPAGAPAATTIGNNLSGVAPTIAYNCSVNGCTISMHTLDATYRAAGGLTAPTAGVITRWRARVGNTADKLQLRVLRPGNSSNRAAAGSSAVENAVVNATTTYDTRLPVQAGDAIGLNCCGGPFGLTAILGPVEDGGVYGAYRWDPPLADGGLATAATGQFFRDVPFNADIEPDADGDGYGDETQDDCPDDASKHEICKSELELTKTVDRATAVVGEAITYTVTIKNNGPALAPNVTLADTLPSNVTFVDATPSLGTCSTPPPLTCAIGNLSNGATATVTITTTAAAAGSAVNVASVSSDETDLVPGNNSAQAVTEISPAPVTTPPPGDGTPQPSPQPTPLPSAAPLPAASGPCANLKRGTNRADTLVGTAAGDRLVGRGGNDRLSGLAGADCLAGDAGNDRLNGGRGRDQLNGGKGNDVISARDGERDTVNCGAGRDRATVDKRDRVRGCERVTRR